MNIFNFLIDFFDDVVVNPTDEDLEYLRENSCLACGSLTHTTAECREGELEPEPSQNVNEPHE